MVDALKRASAKRITVVMPFYPYARQDKKHRGREPISARLVADLFKTAGRRPADGGRPAHRRRSRASSTARSTTCSRCRCSPEYVRGRVDVARLTVVSPDAGRVRVAERWTQVLGGCPLAFIHKTPRPAGPERGRRQPGRR